MEDIDALIEALREGRPLDEGETNLLDRVGEAVRFRQPDPVPTEDEASLAVPERVLAMLSKFDADLPQS